MGIQYKSNRHSQKMLELLGGVNHWTILETKIGEIEDTTEKGFVFEEFCKIFLNLTSKYKEFKFTNIWSFKDVPEKIRSKLGIVQKADYGIDIVIECEDGNIWTIQCKFRSNREPIPHGEISTFYRSSKYANFKIVFSNSHLVATPLEAKQKDEGLILGNDLDLIEESFYEMLRQFLKNLHVDRRNYLKNPFKYQENIIEKCLNHYQTEKNGQLIMACGSGKTYVSLWVKEKLKPLNTIVFVPSLALMKQTFNEWTNQRKDDFYYSCICSDKTVVSDADEPQIAISEFGVPVTTNSTELIHFLKDNTKNPKVVFSTYQSTDVVLEAIRNISDFKFDFGIFDEAHKTSGKSKRMFSACLDVQINKRLFMTATPKIYLEYLREKAKEEDIELFSMDDASVYGKVIFELKFSDAIREGILADYQIKIITITNEEVKKLIQRCQELQIEDRYGYYKEVSADRLAKQIAIIKAMEWANRVISFHTTINEAKKFALEQNTISIPNTIKLMADSGQKVPEIKTFHIAGNFQTSKRSDILKEFGDCQKAILSNARCLTEGVDLPAIDGVYFVDPKQSIIDIVQATGRAIRKDKKNPNKIGYIIISIFVSENEDHNKILQTGAFKVVWRMINAMKSQDARIMEIIDKLKMDKVKEYYDDKALDKKENAKLVKEFDRFIKVENIPAKFDKEEFIKSIRLRTIDTLGSAWFEWYERLKQYHQKTGWWPHVHTKGKESRLGKWTSNQRRRCKEKILSKEKINLLKEIGFPFEIWGPLDGFWLRNYNKLKKYKEETGRWPPNIGRGSKLYSKEEVDVGSWLQHQRYWYKKGKVPQERIKLLNQLGGDWFNDSTRYHRDSLWEKMYREFVEFKKNNPNRIPLAKKGNEGKLHRWIYMQKELYQKGRLPSDRLNKLKEAGFSFEAIKNTTSTWLSKLNELKGYKEKNGKWPPTVGKFSDKYTEYEIRLGNWLRTQRWTYNLEKLSPDKIKLLESIAGDWLHDDTLSSMDEQWDKRYSQLVEFRKINPSDWPLKNSQDDGLYDWFYWQKRAFQKGILKEERLQKLKEINFPFEKIPRFKPIIEKKQTNKPVISLSWHEWYFKLQQFKKDNPDRWPIRKGEEEALAAWCSRRRLEYNKGQLKKEEIEKLNEIGFPWAKQKSNFNLWLKKYNELLEFKKRNPQPNKWPHARMKDKGDIELGKWIGAQRQRYKQGKLEKNKFELLKKLNFVFAPQEEINVYWMKMYGSVKKFKESNGRFPRRIIPPKDEYTKYENKFGTWCYRQQSRYKDKTISDKEIDLLNKIGFDWKEQRISNYRPDVWEEKYNKLKEFREKYNRWPQPYNKGEEELHNFWKGQKRAHMLGQITPERIEKLKKIPGFEFERRSYGKKKSNKK